MFRIVPNYLADQLNGLLDAEIAKCPDAAKDRDVLYGQLLDYVDAHGVVPQFSLSPAQVSA